MPTERVAATALPDLCDPEAIATIVDRQAALKAKRSADLTASMARWLGQYGNGITDDDLQGRTADLVRQVAAFARRVDEERLALRQDLAEALDDLDARYRSLTAGHEQPIATIRKHLETYAAERAAAELRRRKERAERTRRRADTQAQQAAETGDADAIFAALAADMRAEQAAEKAAAPLAELSRVRGEFGSQVGLRQVWRWREIDAELVPRQYLALDRGKIEQARRDGMVDGKCTASIPGIEFYLDMGVAVS